jgi:tetratricopeptide (TPR) repeat protein/transcriptional regulator with XRE-family HTH domain
VATEQSARSCDRCGVRLAGDNTDTQCSSCRRSSALKPPVVPREFWDIAEMRDALATWHIGRVIYVYRTHPWHSQPLSQEAVGGWLGLTQPQVSRLESGRAIEDLGRLIPYAQVLRIPGKLLWFKLPDEPRDQPTMLPDAIGQSAVAVIAAPYVDLRPTAGSEGAVLTIAGESADFATSEAARTVAPMSVVQLTAELEHLARRYGDVPPLEMLDQARRLRNESHRLSERTRAPGQLADLHLITGAACGLLARASWDLGAWSAAIEQAHAAGIYGQLVGHSGLQAWAAGTEALIAFWRGRPRDAVAAAERGLQLATAGTPQARLRCIAARAWAYLGAADRVQAELASADEALGQAGGPNAEILHDEIAGEYGWNQARHAMCAATALLGAGDLYSAAARAREAIAFPAGGDAADDLVTAKALADLACVELASGRLDAAQDALDPVWDVAPEFRSYPLIGRLESAAATLTGPRYAHSRSATDLGERIRVYCGTSAPALASRQMLSPGG